MRIAKSGCVVNHSVNIRVEPVDVNRFNTGLYEISVAQPLDASGCYI